MLEKDIKKYLTLISSEWIFSSHVGSDFNVHAIMCHFDDFNSKLVWESERDENGLQYKITFIKHQNTGLIQYKKQDQSWQKINKTFEVKTYHLSKCNFDKTPVEKNTLLYLNGKIHKNIVGLFKKHDRFIFERIHVAIEENQYCITTAECCYLMKQIFEQDENYVVEEETHTHKRSRVLTD